MWGKRAKGASWEERDLEPQTKVTLETSLRHSAAEEARGVALELREYLRRCALSQGSRGAGQEIGREAVALGAGDPVQP